MPVLEILGVSYPIIESAPTTEIIHDPKHPYTQALMRAIPIPDPAYGREGVELRGTPGDASNMPSGCRFKDRCPERMDICDEMPAFGPLADADEHQVACHLYTDDQPDVHRPPISSAESGGVE